MLTLPKSSKDLIGDTKTFPKLLSDLRTAIREHGRVLIYGPPGIGKTSSVYVIANELGFDVIEINASDERKRENLKEILKRCQQIGLDNEKLLFLLDEADGLQAWAIVEEIVKKSIHPVILTCNESYKISPKLQSLLIKFKYKPPLLQDVVRHIRKLRPDTEDFSGVSTDIRSSIISSSYGSERYFPPDIFAAVESVFKNSDPSKIDEEKIPYLIDNATRFYSGVDIYNFYRILEIAVRTRLSLLSVLPEGKGQRVVYPYYLKRMTVLRGKDKKEEEEKTT